MTITTTVILEPAESAGDRISASTSPMQKEYQCMTYIMANKPRGVLYVGVTGKGLSRICEHKQGLVDGFTKKYRLKTLVYREAHETMEQAIRREKQIKNLVRRKKIALIESVNPGWRDLYDEIL